MRRTGRKMRTERLYAILISAALLSGCTSNNGAVSSSAPASTAETQETTVASTAAVSENETASQAAPSLSLAELPGIGDTVSGFKVKNLGEIKELGAKSVLFDHEKSGAELLYIQNDDKELGFDIIYRTPETDETDAEHVFEHAILASSDKYPSKDIFFDMNSKTFNSFINATTYPIITCYPVCSMSEEQLQKMADVYLSCMVAPGILKNENFFKREAIRYNLENKEDPITIEGTVYSEDYGQISSVSNNAGNNLLDALYPGMIASNMLGRSCNNYKELTYEHVCEVYNKYYHFDNSLIVLYGNMDYRKMLDFIDRDYLSKAEKSNSDIIGMFDEKVPEGHEDKTVEVPVYKGDNTKNAAQIGYAADLTGFSEEEMAQLDMLALCLNNDSSVFRRKCRDAGITGNAYCYQPFGECYAGNFFSVQVTDADGSQKDAFYKAIIAALQDVKDNGIPDEIVQAVCKQEEISEYTARNARNIAVSTAAQIGLLWSLTGRTDYFEQKEKALEAVKTDTSQQIVKSLAGKLLNAKRTALVASVPKEGLAEKFDQNISDELAAKKKSMSDEEIEKMIADTKAFDEWNESELSNNDFMIESSKLPDPNPVPTVTTRTLGDITSLSVPVTTEKAGNFEVLFDTSAIAQEDLKDMALYCLLLNELDTANHSKDDLANKTSEYLSNLTIDFIFPEKNGTGLHYPMFTVKWTGLNEDYDKSADLLLDIMQNSNFNDSKKILTAFGKYKNTYDEAKVDPFNEAQALVNAYINSDAAYSHYVMGQDFYHYMLETEEKLEKDPAYAETIQKKMTDLEKKIVQKNRMVTMTAAVSDKIPDIEKVIAEKFGALPGNTSGNAEYTLPYEKVQKVAVYVESSNQNCYFASRISECKQFRGKYLPYLEAVSDKYIVPTIRFQNGAYSAGMAVGPVRDDAVYAYTYSDPNVKSSIEALQDIPNQISGMKLDEKDFNGYVLHAYSNLCRPVGNLDNAINTMTYFVKGKDTGKVAEMAKDMKSASLSDQQDAADAVQKLMDNGVFVMTGNEEKMKKDEGYFDTVIDYRK